MTLRFLLLFSLLLTFGPMVSAQEADQSIDRLKTEIARRETIDRDDGTPTELRKTNRANLDNARTALLNEVQARIAALEKYVNTLGDSMTPAEKSDVRSALQKLSAEANESAGANSSVTRVNNSPLQPEPLPIGAPAAALPVAVNGKVTINNDGTVSNAKDVKVVLSQVAANGQRTALEEARTQDDGTYTVNIPAGGGQYVITAYVGDFSAEMPSNQPNIEVLVRPLGEFSRAIVGLEQSGASSAKSTQRFFLDLTLSAPLPWGKRDEYFGRRFRTWGSARITSVPQQINTGVAEFAGAFAQKVGEVKVNELAHGMEFLAGGDYRLPGSYKTNFGSFGADVATRFTLSFILGGGIITPFTPRDTLEIFKVFRDAPGLPPVPEGKEFIAFVSPDRDRFFRQFYAGFRLQSHYFDYNNPTVPLKRYPATLDITYGQNEAVTGGRLRGGVIRLEGFFPLPYEGLKFINLFGTALIKPTRTKITDPLILEAAPVGTTIPAGNVFLFTEPQINRDYYRIGVGIDFMSLISKWKAVTKR